MQQKSEHYTIKNKSVFYILVVVILLCLFLTIAHFIFFSESKLALIVLGISFFAITFKKVKLGIYLSAFLIPLIPRISARFGTANFSIAEFIVLILIFNWILYILLSKQLKFKRTKLDLIILVFLFLTVVSFFLSIKHMGFPLRFSSSLDSLYPLKVLLNTFECIFLFYLIVNVIDKKGVRVLVNTSLASILLVSSIATVEFVDPDNPLSLYLKDEVQKPSFRKISIRDGTLEIFSYPVEVFRWGHSYISTNIFAVNSSKKLSIEGFTKIRYISNNGYAKMSIVCLNESGGVIKFIPTSKTNLTNQWVRISDELILEEGTSNIKVSLDTYVKNSTVNAAVYFDNVTVKQEGTTVMTETFDDLLTWNNYTISLTDHLIKSRAKSTFNQPNTLGMYLILFLPLAILLFIEHRRLFFLFSSITSLLALVFTYSRGAIAGFIAANVLFFKQNKKTIRIATVFIMLLLILMFFQFSLLVPIIEKGLSFQDRVDIFKESFNLMKENPLFGIGLGTFRMVNNLEPDTHHAHNIYLQIAVERGLITLLVFLIFLFVFYRESFKTKAHDSYLNLVKQSLLIGITALLIHGLVDYSFYNQRVNLLFWMVIGIVIVSNKD